MKFDSNAQYSLKPKNAPCEFGRLIKELFQNCHQNNQSLCLKPRPESVPPQLKARSFCPQRGKVFSFQYRLKVKEMWGKEAKIAGKSCRKMIHLTDRMNWEVQNVVDRGEKRWWREQKSGRNSSSSICPGGGIVLYGSKVIHHLQPCRNTGRTNVM